MNTLTFDFTKWSNLFTHAEWQEDYSICLTFQEYVSYKKAWVAYVIKTNESCEFCGALGSTFCGDDWCHEKWNEKCDSQAWKPCCENSMNFCEHTIHP